MTSRDPKPPGKAQEKPSSDAARDRLAAALRENLKRRKAQERGRDAKTEPKPED
ncbi:MAG: hypothetical protein IT566_08405 [Rhodospirillaceae bacterium]|nr:hypothetical protein [Rhodospirillaceae bacterium]